MDYTIYLPLYLNDEHKVGALNHDFIHLTTHLFFENRIVQHILFNFILFICKLLTPFEWSVLYLVIYTDNGQRLR